MWFANYIRQLLRQATGTSSSLSIGFWLQLPLLSCSIMLEPRPSVPDVSFPLDLMSRSSCLVPQRHNSCPLLIQPHSGFPVCWDESRTVTPLSIQPHSGFPVCWDESRTVTPLSIQPHWRFPVCWDHRVLSQDLIFPEPFKSRSPCKLCLLWRPSIFTAVQSFVQFLGQVVLALCADDGSQFFWAILVSALLPFCV